MLILLPTWFGSLPMLIDVPLSVNHTKVWKLYCAWIYQALLPRKTTTLHFLDDLTESGLTHPCNCSFRPVSEETLLLTYKTWQENLKDMMSLAWSLVEGGFIVRRPWPLTNSSKVRMVWIGKVAWNRRMTSNRWTNASNQKTPEEERSSIKWLQWSVNDTNCCCLNGVRHGWVLHWAFVSWPQKDKQILDIDLNR